MREKVNMERRISLLLLFLSIFIFDRAMADSDDWDFDGLKNDNDNRPYLADLYEPTIMVGPVEYGIRYQVQGSNTRVEKTVKSDEDVRTQKRHFEIKDVDTSSFSTSLAGGVIWPSDKGIFNLSSSIKFNQSKERTITESRTRDYEATQKEFNEFFNEQKSTISYAADSGFARADIFFANVYSREIILNNIEVALLQTDSSGETVRKVLINGCLRIDNTSISADSGRNFECDTQKNRTVRIPPSSITASPTPFSIYFEGLRTDVLLSSIPGGDRLQLEVISYDMSFRDSPGTDVPISDVRARVKAENLELYILGTGKNKLHEYISPSIIDGGERTIEKYMEKLGVEIELERNQTGIEVKRIGADSAEFAIESDGEISDSVESGKKTWIAVQTGSPNNETALNDMGKGVTLYFVYLSKQELEDARWKIRKHSARSLIEVSESNTEFYEFCIDGLFRGERIVMRIEAAASKPMQVSQSVTSANAMEIRPELRRPPSGYFAPENYSIVVHSEKKETYNLRSNELEARLEWNVSNFSNIQSRTEKALRSQSHCKNISEGDPTIECKYVVDEDPYDNAGGKICLRIKRPHVQILKGRTGSFPSSVGTINHGMAIRGWSRWIGEDPVKSVTLYEGLEVRLRAESRQPRK